MKNSRWILHRVGLVNFWYYDEEEFRFLDGRMLLRGSNGSGKSVTMQSFIPLLLDGNMRPERLDPFGSRARKMDNYLLEEDDAREERIGYLYMELKREDVEQYLTLGIGLRARKYKKLESWYFCITDGRRIGKDLFLYRDVKEKIPFTKVELRNRISDGGWIIDTQHEYMEQVNKLLFGFETIDEYKEMLELLIQLRTPKLSKDFKPSIINDILSNSLQTLSEDDLRPLSEAIENMDSIKTNMEELQAGIKAAAAIERIFHTYSCRVLYDKAQGYLNAKKETELLEKRKKEAEKDYQQSETDLQKENENYKNIICENDVLEEERKSLESNDAFRLKQEEQSLLEEKERAVQIIAAKEKQHQKKEELRKELEEKRKKQEEKNEIYQGEMEEKLSEMEEFLTDIPFDSGRFFIEELKERKGEEISFSVYEKEYQTYFNQVEEGIRILQREKLEKERYEEQLLELEESREKRSAAEREQRQYDNLLLETKGELLEEFYRWNSGNEIIKLSEKEMQEISTRIDEYVYGKNYMEIREIVQLHAMEEKERIRGEIGKIDGELQPKKREYSEIEQERNEWAEKKDPEPDREPGVVKHREKLKEMGIDFYPLYTVIDFADHLTEKQRGRLEEALVRMGILDAIIIPSADEEKILKIAEEDGIHDKYLFGDAEHVKRNISELLEIDNEENDIMFYQAVSGVLSGIGAGQKKGDTWINEDGIFRLGILEGSVSGEYQPKFIGRAARERYRLEKLQELERELDMRRAEIMELEQEIEAYRKRLMKAEEEKNKLPQEGGMVSAAKDLADAEHLLENIQRELQKKEEAVNERRKALEQVREKVQEICGKAYLTIRLEVFETARENLREYGRNFRQVEKTYGLYRNGLSMVQGYALQLEDVEADLDDILYEKVQTENRKKKIEGRLESVLDQLQMSDYNEIKDRLEHCIERLKVLPELRDKSTRKRTQLEDNMRHLKSRLEEFDKSIVLLRKKEEQMEIVFQKEFALGYVQLQNETEAPPALAGKLVRELEAQITSQTAEELHGRVQEVFHENKGFLIAYRITIQNIFMDLKEECDAVSERITRLDIRAKYRGLSVSFPELLEKLTADAELQEKLLSDKDKELFEDILAGIISKKIRARIHASKRWVKNMNQLMESMQTSSGLRLSLKWKSKKAEKEEQLDTGSLVELLEQDVEIMQEADVEKLSMHFRSKIAEARQRMDGVGGVQSFHVIMREILDYRAWFEFCLECQKTGEKKKEMTDRVFFTFSGGEKAMSMYVPLFSAVVAKYSGAREDAPRLISLDEAFAGVDEMNIKDMFRLMVELKFNFMINSQILWGDYETVPALAIYQLVRPQNAKYVSVIPYKWNGKNRELVVKQEILEEHGTT